MGRFIAHQLQAVNGKAASTNHGNYQAFEVQALPALIPQNNAFTTFRSDVVSQNSTKKAAFPFA
ncbi:hypothetical protein K239x_09440 [Planctomycetes bacterium K23_9]|uniref:Uncharacterized protein n=1 Tax=Stieleria marina TaxID=1930275 RepID=A0A517NPF0_9BACT|nr:hypothetical protein K239x_09440 [Planctomycetes bacterium K23_9]